MFNNLSVPLAQQIGRYNNESGRGKINSSGPSIKLVALGTVSIGGLTKVMMVEWDVFMKSTA